MPTLYIMVGVGFSGKSTLSKKIAEHLDISLVSQDALYFEKQKEWDLHEDSDEQWEMLFEKCKERIRDLLSHGQSVVFDHVNLMKQHRDGLRKIVEDCGARSVVVFLDTPEDVQIERQKRNLETKERHDVKQEYLDDAKRQLEIPTSDENAYFFTPETNLETFLNNLPK